MEQYLREMELAVATALKCVGVHPELLKPLAALVVGAENSNDALSQEADCDLEAHVGTLLLCWCPGFGASTKTKGIGISLGMILRDRKESGPEKFIALFADSYTSDGGGELSARICAEYRAALQELDRKERAEVMRDL